MKKIHLKDIAKSLNLSKTTVSLVLNNRGDEQKISKKTQKLIVDFAKKHNYKPNQLARGLSKGKSETIGLIIPNISNIFYANIASRIEKRAKDFGYSVVFSSSNEDPATEHDLISSMLNRQVDGLIIASTQKNLTEIKLLKYSGFPFVLIDRHYPNMETNYVIVDNYGGVRNATNHLWNNGRTRIGFVSLKLEMEVLKQRLFGYQNTINNLTNSQNNDFVKELSLENYKNEMKLALTELVISPNRVDAIIFATHFLASSGFRELLNMDVKVPQDIAIISFDEFSAFDLVDPPITSVIQPVTEISDFAVEILVDEMEKKGIILEKNKILDTELMVRKSCGI